MKFAAWAARVEKEQGITASKLAVPGSWRVSKCVLDGDRIVLCRETCSFCGGAGGRCENCGGVGSLLVNTRFTFPAARVELPTEISKVKSGDQQAAVRFANTYGLLTTKGDAEPLRTVWDQAVRMHHTLELAKLATSGRTPAAATVMKLLQQENDMLADLHGQPPKTDAELRVEVVGVLKDAGETRTNNRVVPVLAGRLSRALQHARVAFTATQRDRQLALTYRFNRLIDLAYWQVAESLTLRKRLRRCPRCHHIFIVTHQKRKFCPSSADQQDADGHGESRCGDAYRHRVARSRHE